MNIYALLSLCASAISIVLGLSVYVLNRKSNINKLFMLAMFFNAYWAFCTFGKTIADSSSTALLWTKALSFWPFLVPLMLHFTLAFTESDLLKRKLTYAALYLPPLLFSVIDLTTDWITGATVMMPWGYVTILPVDSMVANIGGVWSAILGLLIVFFYTQYYKRIGDKTKKQQTKFVAFGFIVPILLSLVTDSISPAINIVFPGLGSISGSITSLFVVYAMLRYNLFSFRPEIALENVFSTMADSVIIVNLKGLIIKVNSSLIELTGLSESELVGKYSSEILKKAGVINRDKTTPQILPQLIKVREIRNYEICFDTEKGGHKTCMLSCSMVTDNNGHDVGAAFILHDITERKAMEQKILRSERLASIGELAGILGHDLRNPLSGIRGAAYYLKQKHANLLDEEDLVMFECIDKGINYSNKIINDLLDYSNEITLGLSPVTPKTLVQDSLSMVVQPENITIVNDTVDLPVVYVDAERISRGFAGLIKNAYDAMPEGGDLTVECTVMGDSIVFMFKDTGFGMTKEILGKLGMPLFTTKAKGMGFGLPICKRYVEAHGGKISVESTPEMGTVVQVELPLHLDGANQK